MGTPRAPTHHGLSDTQSDGRHGGMRGCGPAGARGRLQGIGQLVFINKTEPVPLVPDGLSPVHPATPSECPSPPPQKPAPSGCPLRPPVPYNPHRTTCAGCWATSARFAWSWRTWMTPTPKRRWRWRGPKPQTTARSHRRSCAGGGFVTGTPTAIESNQWCCTETMCGARRASGVVRTRYVGRCRWSLVRSCVAWSRR